MPLPTTSHAVALPYIGDGNDDPNIFTLGEIASVLADSTAVSSITSGVTSAAASGALDSIPVSTADSKAVSAASRASVADSKALSVSGNASVADSKALSVSVNVSVADSKAVSLAAATTVLTAQAHSENVSRADSKAVSVATYSQPLPAGGRTVTALSTYTSNNAVYNVLDFGALGDGSTDDTTAIQAAIAAMPSGGGGRLLFPPGKTYMSDTITLNKTNITIEAWGATIKKRAGTVGHLFSDTAAAADGLVVLGGTYDMNRTSFAFGNAVSAFFFNRTRDLTFIRNTFQNGAENALKFFKTQNVWVWFPKVSNFNNIGIEYNAGDGTDPGFTGSRANQDLDGFWVLYGHFEDVQDGYVGAIDGSAIAGGVSETKRTRNVWIVGNHALRCSRGFWNENNTIPAENINYVGNTCEEIQSYGMGMVGVEHGKMIGNNIYNCGSWEDPAANPVPPAPYSTVSESIGITVSGAAISPGEGVLVSENNIIDNRGTPRCMYGIKLTRGDSIRVMPTNRIDGMETANFYVPNVSFIDATAGAESVLLPDRQRSIAIRHSAANSIPDGIWTGLALDTAVQSSAYYTHTGASGQIRIDVPGVYDIRAMAAFAANATGIRGGRIMLNGATILGETILPTLTGEEFSAPVFRHGVRLTAGDLVRVFLYQNSGGALNALTDRERNALVVEKIS